MRYYDGNDPIIDHYFYDHSESYERTSHKLFWSDVHGKSRKLSKRMQSMFWLRYRAKTVGEIRSNSQTYAVRALFQVSLVSDTK